MAIVKLQTGFRQLLPFVALLSLIHGRAAIGQIKLSPGQVPIGDNELNSPIDEPQVTIQENSSNAVMRPVPQEIQNSTDPLIKLVYETREAQRRRLLSTAENTPWQIMHGMLALREDYLIRHDGKPVNCLEWIQSGPKFEGEAWFEKTQVRVLTVRGGRQVSDNVMVGRGHPYNKPYAFEGHINQFTAILSMSGVPLETQFATPQGPVSMRDLLTYAKLTVNEKEEVTWSLWALSRYLPPDAEWINSKGEKWSIERLVKVEVGKSLQGAPCGGTHGLFALAHARNVYLRSGKPLVGVWLEAEQKIRRYIQTARMQQNSNGTLSSNYFRGREFKPAFDKRMASSGHVLEFLMMALPSRELSDPWVRRAIEATSNDLMANRKAFVSCSPLYHATSALSIYLDRVAKPELNIAQGAPKTHTISNSKEIKSADASVANPEAVKSPVLESSGVDSSGAPKELIQPSTKVPDVPTEAAKKPAMEPTPAEPTPTEPTPTEPTPTEPTPTEPTPAEPTPAEPTPAEPTPAEPTPAEPTPAEPALEEFVPTEPLQKVPSESDPILPLPTEPDSRPETSAEPIPLAIPVITESIVVQPQPKSISTPIAASQDPAPIASNVIGVDSASQVGEFGSPPAVAVSPEKSIPSKEESAAVAPKSHSATIIVMPFVPKGSSRILPSSKPVASPSDRDKPEPSQKKSSVWKATLLERRKVIVVEESPKGE